MTSGAHHPVQPSLMRLALLFYAGCTALAFGWGALAGRPLLLLWPTSPRAAGIGALVGLALGLLVVVLSHLLLRWSSWARDLFEWFASLLGPISTGQAVLLAAVSAIGEELLFRGAMQASLGLLLTSLIFALLHFPQRLRLWPWTVSAALLGLAFGVIADRSGHLGGPLLAHFVINALNLAQVGRRAAATARKPLPEKLPAVEGAPSIDGHGEGNHHHPSQQLARGPEPGSGPGRGRG